MGRYVFEIFELHIILLGDDLLNWLNLCRGRDEWLAQCEEDCGRGTGAKGDCVPLGILRCGHFWKELVLPESYLQSHSCQAS